MQTSSWVSQKPSLWTLRRRVSRTPIVVAMLCTLGLSLTGGNLAQAARRIVPDGDPGLEADGGSAPTPPPPSPVPSPAPSPAPPPASPPSAVVVLQPAASCPWWNPICLIAEGLDALWDDVTSVLALTWDIITLNPEEAFEDFAEIAYNHVCNHLTILSLVVSHGLEADFDECASPPHPIEPAVQVMLRRYIHSSLDSVRIHEGCHLDADVIPGEEAPHRGAITFGEHIYFKPGRYHPLDPEGLALLAHELTHVLQYRQKGLGDFTCEYGLSCGLGLNPSCEIERKAYEYQALVLDDQYHDSDGIFTQVDNCPDHFNPGQRDSNGNGLGNACDPGNQCVNGATRHQACGGYHSVGSGYDYVCDNGWWEMAGGWCAYNPPSTRPGGGGQPPQEP